MNYSAVFVAILLLTLVGCANADPQLDNATNDSSMLNLTDPDEIAHWEASSDNIDHSKIKVVKLSYFYNALGNNEPKPTRAVAIEISEARLNGITLEQQQALDFFIENERDIHATVRKAIYNYYQDLYPDIKKAHEHASALYGGPANTDDIPPPILNGTELDQIVNFASIRINSTPDGKATIGIEAFGKWDINGIGLRLQDGEVVEIGNAYVGL